MRSFVRDVVHNVVHSVVRNVARGVLCSSLLVIAFWTTLSAHDTWIVPKQWVMKPSEPFSMTITSGEAFPKPQHPIEASRISSVGVRIGTSSFLLLGGTALPKATELKGTVGGYGVATAYVVLRPRTITLKPHQVRHYLQEIGASDSLQAAWNKPSKTMRWRETYAKHAKSLLCVASSPNDVGSIVAADTAFSKPIGQVLELVPLANPLLLKAGDTLLVKVLFNKQPLVGVSVGAAHEGSTKGVLVKTNAEGVANIVLRKSGVWLVRCTHLRPASESGTDAGNDGESSFESDFATLTFKLPFKPRGI